MSASSWLSVYHQACRGRLNLEREGNGSAGGWTAEVDDQKQYLSVDLLNPMLVSGVIIQGRDGHDSWVVQFLVKYKVDTDDDEWKCLGVS